MHDEDKQKLIIECLESHAFYSVMGLAVIADTYLRRLEMLTDFTKS